MKLVSGVKRVTRYSEEDENFWMEHRTKFLESDLSLRAYCRTKGINAARFHYWKKVLERKQCEMLAKNVCRPKLNKIFPVEIKEEPASKELGLCSIKLTTGLILQIHAWSVVAQILSKVC